METIQEEDTGRKFVSVVYHHVSYQNEVSDVIKEARTGGSCHLVSERDNQSDIHIPDYLPLSLLSLFVFLPCGVMALNNSLKVKKSKEISEEKSAIDASNWAIQYVLLAFFIGPMMMCTLFIAMYLPTH